MLHVSLTLFGCKDVVISFGIDETDYSMPFRESVGEAVPMFPRPPRKVGSRTHVERTISRLVMMYTQPPFIVQVS
jgi:hypothetical protein